LTARTERKGKEILDKALALPPKEFRQWMKDYSDEISAEGVFNDDNYFAALNLQEEVQSAGFDPSKEQSRSLPSLKPYP
jgi:hypothetical protein